MRAGGKTSQVVINRYEAKNSTFSADRLLEPIGVPSLLTIARDDASATAAMHKGCPLRLAAPRSPVVADVVSLTRALVGPGNRSSQDSSGIVGRIRRVFSRT
jgi:Flp pilus assembly CpaE family ATPase